MKLVICKWAHCINHTHNAHSLLNFSALWPRSDWGLRLCSSRVFHKSASRDCFDISESLCSCARGSPLISWVQSQKGTRGLAEAHVSYRISGRDSDTPWLTPVEQTLRSPDSRLCTRPTWVQITEYSRCAAVTNISCQKSWIQGCETMTGLTLAAGFSFERWLQWVISHLQLQQRTRWEESAASVLVTKSNHSIPHRGLQRWRMWHLGDYFMPTHPELFSMSWIFSEKKKKSCKTFTTFTEPCQILQLCSR